MVTRELSYGRKEINICDGYDNDCYTHYHVLAHEKQIIETARMLNSLGDEFLRDVTFMSASKVEEYFATDSGYNGLHSVVSTVDTLLEWLELRKIENTGWFPYSCNCRSSVGD